MSGSLLRGRYERLGVVGAGGQGEVLLALDRQHDRRVAIKMRRVGSDVQREQVLAEARILLNLRPHVGVPLLREDFFEGDRYFLVMDWVDGSSLASELRERGDPGLPYEEVCRWIGQVAAALDHLHGHDPPIIHKDVKPANIVVTADERAVLVDFGIARSGDGASLAGTPAYLAPEIVLADAPGPPADVFALAVTVYELLTGELPRPGASPDWRGIPPEHRPRVVATIQRGLSIDPERRPRSASELAEGISPPATRHNLPAAFSSFVGRERELDELLELLERERLVTLTGTGGVGKTRLAIELARRLLPRYPAGVILAELAPLSGPSLVTSAVARAAGVPEQADASLLDALTAALRSGRRLLLLDNCEHVIDEAVLLVETLLRACPDLAIVTTSREALRLTGERVWQVPSLETPAEGDEIESLRAVGSVRLFEDRANAATGTFTLAEDNAPAVAQICRRLDGIPLAVELTAAAVAEHPADEIAAGLDDRFRLLTGGSRTSLERHQTLHAAVEWSHSLLAENERTLLRRLAVFAGGFERADIAEVCAGDTLAPGEAEELLDRLAAKSLVEPVPAEPSRFRLLEPIRQYALERLLDTGESAAIRRRHRDRFVALAETAEPLLVSPESPAWMTRLDLELDNLRAAQDWALVDDPSSALRIGAAIWRYWESRASFGEATQRLRAALDASEPTPTPGRARCLAALALFTALRYDLTAAEGLVREALEAAREANDLVSEALAHATEASFLVFRDSPDARDAAERAVGLARSLRGKHPYAPRLLAQSLKELITYEQSHGHGRRAALARELWEAAYGSGDPYLRLTAVLFTSDTVAEAREALDPASAVELARSLGERMFETTALLWAAEIALESDDLETARAHLEETLALARNQGAPGVVAVALASIGLIALAQKDVAEARTSFQQLAEVIPDAPWVVALSEAGLARVAVAERDLDAAGSHVARAGELLGADPERESAADLARSAADLAHARGDPRRVVMLLAAEHACRAGTQTLDKAWARLGTEKLVDEAKAALGERVFETAWEEGLGMTPAEAVRLAIQTAS